MHAIRPVLSLILAVWFLQLSGGMLSVVTPIGLSEMGTSSIGVGIIAGLYATGFMAGAYFSPRLIGEIGNIRVFAAGAALTAVGALSQGLWTSEIGWALVRFVQGATFAGMFAAAEAWLGRVTPQQHRGNVLGVYNVSRENRFAIGAADHSWHGTLGSDKLPLVWAVFGRCHGASLSDTPPRAAQNHV